VTLNLRYELRALLGQSPLLFHSLIRLRGRKASFAVGPKTEVVIEGYPRSGNTFAAAAFQLAQGREVRIARHLHVSAQILAAARRRLPTILLIRHPHDAVLSTVIRHPEWEPHQAVREYTRFYRSCFDLRPHFVLGRFEEVTRDFGSVVERLNRRFGASFRSFVHSEDNVRRVFAEVERMDREDTGSASVTEATVGRPSDHRRHLKSELRARVEGDADLRRRFDEAIDLYHQIVTTIDR